MTDMTDKETRDTTFPTSGKGGPHRDTGHSPSRLMWADALKGWLIILVVLGHAIQWALGKQVDGSHTWNLIYSFHMSAFMAVSGWLAYRPHQKAINIGTILSRRAHQLLVPFFCWTILFILIKGWNLLSSLWQFIYKPDDLFWFLWVLFFIQLIFVLLQQMSHALRISPTLPLTATALVLPILIGFFRTDSFGIHFIVFYLMFFVLGYLTHQYHALQTHSKALLITLGLVWLLLAWHWRMHDLPSWMPTPRFLPEAIVQYAYRAITATVANVVILNAAPLLLNGSSRLNTWIALLGQWSLGVYVAHLSLLLLFGHAIMRLLPPSVPYWLRMPLLFVFAFTLSTAIVFLLKKNKYTARLFLGKI